VWAEAAAQTPSFQERVEDALRRHSGEGTEAPAPPLAPEPIPPTPPAEPVAPVAPPPAEQTTGPRPYTPPSGSPGASPGAPPPATGSGQAAERTRESLTAEEVNAASFVEDAEAIRGASPLILKAQVLLDRAGASPGVIDAYYGANVAKAIAAVETVLGLTVDGALDRQVWEALGGDDAPQALVEYAITAEDMSYPFLPSIPADFAEQAKLPALGYTSPEEMFGERFHMDVKLLRALNPAADFRRVGETIWVAAIEGEPVVGTIAHIVADKGQRQVRAYDGQNRLVVAYPATIGSSDNPSPTGEHVVEGIAKEPVYYYDPANFVQGDNTTKLELPPGPNNPVGTVWIDLSEPSYGIHGTPEPAKIDKTGSHGCVRLTNWDAEELAALVQPGVLVTFIE
jgi:lipoprotein-anchoring transpeptidase ErfK/SrfK